MKLPVYHAIDLEYILEISQLITEDPDLFNTDINRRLEMDSNIDDEHNKKEEFRQEQEREKEQEQLEKDRQEKIIKPQLDKIGQSFENIGQESDETDESLEGLDNELNRLSLLLKRFEGSI